MAGGFDPILGPDVVGMIGRDGNLTPAARLAFVTQVASLLQFGNANGKGPKLSSVLGVPFPPIAGPPLPDPDLIITQPSNPLAPLFWFAPSPFALATIPILSDPDKDYQKIVVDSLYVPLVKMLNVKGNLATFPIFDPTVFFPSLKDIPGFILALPIALPAISAGTPPGIKFADKFGIKIGDLVSAFVPPPVPIPSIPKLPPLPSFSTITLDFVIFKDLFLGLLELPLKILVPSVMLPKIAAAFPPDPLSLFKAILDLVLGLILDLLKAIGLLQILPKLLSATIIIIIENLVAMMVVDMIGMILGAGSLCKTAGHLLGLV